MQPQSDLFGAPPAPMPQSDEDRKSLFKTGPGILVAAGQTEQRARQIIGRWLKDGHKAEWVLDALTQAQVAGAIDPVSYARKVLAQDRGVNRAMLGDKF